MKIAGVAFDLEGTILDLEQAHHLGHLAAAREIGVDLNIEEAITMIPAFVGGPDSVIAEEITKLSGAGVATSKLLERMRFHYFHNRASLEIRPREGFLRVLESILGLQMRVAIGSVTERDDALFLMKISGLLELFDNKNLVFLENVARPKPDPDVYRQTACRMGISPSEQIVFEDSAIGVSAAVAAGSKPIGVPVIDSDRFIDRLYEAGAHRVFRSWSDIRVDHLLNELEEGGN